MLALAVVAEDLVEIALGLPAERLGEQRAVEDHRVPVALVEVVAGDDRWVLAAQEFALVGVDLERDRGRVLVLSLGLHRQRRALHHTNRDVQQSVMLQVLPGTAALSLSARGELI